MVAGSSAMAVAKTLDGGDQLEESTFKRRGEPDEARNEAGALVDGLKVLNRVKRQPVTLAAGKACAKVRGEKDFIGQGGRGSRHACRLGRSRRGRRKDCAVLSNLFKRAGESNEHGGGLLP